MANNETKTNAEIYREQRKARLAKAAKKKKHGKHDKLVSVLVKLVCILLVAAIVLYFVGSILTSTFCAPQRVLTAAEYGNYKITVAEYNYFYMSLFNQVTNTAQQYDQYYSGMGAQYFDATKDPAEQTCQETDLPEGVVTWADYFAYCAPERAFLVKTFYEKANSAEAKAAGFVITDAERAEIKTAIDEQINHFREQATAQDYALDNYLFKTYGEGVTEELYRKLLEMEAVADLYRAWYQKNATDNVSDADVEAYYAENKADIDVATIRVFGVSYAEAAKDSTDPEYTKDEAKARCDDFIAKLATGADFANLAVEYAAPSQKEDYKDKSATLMKYQTKASLESIYEGLGEWAFAAERVARDTYIIDLETSKTYFVIMLETPASKNETPTSIDVRHILIEVPKKTEEGAALPQETIDLNKTNAYAKAEEVVQKWKDAGATEQAFIDLVAANTNDTGSASTGGLYEGINSSSSYVPEFLEWALGDHAKGDVEIVETTYGYHVMYYVGGDTTPKWESDIRASIGSKAYEDFVLGTSKQIREGLVRKTAVCNFFTKRTEEIIDRIIQNNASYSSYM